MRLARVSAVLVCSEKGSAGPLHKAGTTRIVTNTFTTTATVAKRGGRLHGT